VVGVPEISPVVLSIVTPAGQVPCTRENSAFAGRLLTETFCAKALPTGTLMSVICEARSSTFGAVDRTKLLELAVVPSKRSVATIWYLAERSYQEYAPPTWPVAPLNVSPEGWAVSATRRKRVGLTGCSTVGVRLNSHASSICTVWSAMKSIDGPSSTRRSPYA
jgi:hypothetical protein